MYLPNDPNGIPVERFLDGAMFVTGRLAVMVLAIIAVVLLYQTIMKIGVEYGRNGNVMRLKLLAVIAVVAMFGTASVLLAAPRRYTEPTINIELEPGLSGVVYFEASSFMPSDADNFIYTLDRGTGELWAQPLPAFGMMHQPLGDGRTSVYTFTPRQWRNVRENSGDQIPFADGGQIVIYADGQQVAVVSDDAGLDFHEFEVLDNGNYLYLRSVLNPMYTDSTQTCLPSCNVLSQAIVVRTPDGEVVTDINLLDAYTRDELTMDDMLIMGSTMLYDVTHANSVQRNERGYLVSVRHTSEVIQYNFRGDILWRTRDYEFDSAFSHQHDAQILPSGHLLLFDNANGLRDSSRAVEYELDHEQQTARVVWQYDMGHFAPNRGSVQRLTNGNTLVNFVDGGIVEVNADGDVLMTITLPENFASYQARVVE